MEDTSGFYKLDADGILFAPNAVFNQNFTLLREEKDSYEYPVDGWVWFESSEDAESALK